MTKRLIPFALAFVLGLPVGAFGLGPHSARADDCAATSALAYQPTHNEVRTAIIGAATGSSASGLPRMPNLLTGYPDSRYVAGMAPCLLPQAMSWWESGWRQADRTVSPGSKGPVLTGKGGCGYGLMQISTGMTFPNQLPRDTQLAIAADFRYNAAQGLKILGDKWNATPPIGSNDPSVLEHWYYAIWAYNNWSWRNNPNNPDFPLGRPAFDGTQPAKHYPYQEIILGLVANPPKVNGVALWNGATVRLPDPALIGTSPAALPEPGPTTRVACFAPGSIRLFLPTARGRG